MAYIDSLQSKNTYIRIKSTKTYKRANLEGQKAVRLEEHKKLFSTTANNLPDLLSVS